MRGTITCARRGFPHARSQPSRAGAQRRLGSSHRQDRGSGGSPSASSRRSFRASNSPIGTRRGGSTKCPCCAHRAPNPRPPVGCTTGNCLAGSTRVRGSHCARETPTPPAVALRIPLRPALSLARTCANLLAGGWRCWTRARTPRALRRPGGEGGIADRHRGSLKRHGAAHKRLNCVNAVALTAPVSDLTRSTAATRRLARGQ